MQASMRKRWVILFSALFVFSCQTAPEKKTAMPRLQLENGQYVESCRAYNQARIVFKIAETYANQLLSSQYLSCSLDSSLQPAENQNAVVRAIFHQLPVRSMPLSLAPMVDGDETFSMAGFNMWLEKALLTYTDELVNIEVQYKGQLPKSRHLVWVSDKGLQGNYIAYFPAIVMTKNTETGLVVEGLIPLYQSGF
uniref:hypothetical protein n=1 Tax=Ningiella ruwaisensis TaxID=2364274 RepID=UPI0010A031D0|nr:hypothetical protein [Ningiella ruwaisensis]